MSSKNKKNLESKTKVIRCTNCRQDISAEKMFLHEGFCHRNNKYCEHCDRVFLKEDYEKHVKKISKKNNNEKPKQFMKKELQIQVEEPKKTNQIIQNENENNIKEEIATVVKQSITTINPQSLEYLHLPLTEEYTTINNPIIISENGQIVSNKNKNDYLLPYWGININPNNYKNNNLSEFNMPSTGQNLYYDKEEFLNIAKQNTFSDIQNVFNTNDIEINKIFQTETNIDNRNNYDFNTFGEILTNEKTNNNDLYQNNNQINSTYDYKIFVGNENNNALNSINGLNNIYNFNTTDISIQNQNNKKKIKNIPKKIKNPILNIKESSKIDAKIPLDKNKPKNKKYTKIAKIVKEPIDSSSKINIKSKISLMKQNKNKNAQRQPMNRINKKGVHLNEKNKRKNSSFDEKLFQTTDENGIDEMKKKILQRELMKNNHCISFNNDNSMTQRGFPINNNNRLMNSVDSKRYSYRRKLIPTNNININPQELFSKTQGRYFKNKKKEISLRLDGNSRSFQHKKIKINDGQSPDDSTSKMNKKNIFYSESRNIKKNKNIYNNSNNNIRKNSLYK